MAADQSQPSPDAIERDIIFDCPHCGRSLAINERGAGLIVTCPDCQREAQVPGILLEAQAADEIGQEENPLPPEVAGADPNSRLQALADALANSQAKVKRLVESLEGVRERRTYLEQVRADNMTRFELIGKDLVTIQSAMDRIVGHLQDAAAEKVADGTKPS
jgi:hypothetical protein